MAETRKHFQTYAAADAQRYLTDLGSQVTTSRFAARGEIAYLTSAGQVLIAKRLRSGHIQLDSVCHC